MANFNLIAPYYDRLATLVFGSSIQASQICFCKGTNPDFKKILIFGGGTGKILKPLLKFAPNASITFIDASQKMCDQATKFCKEAGIRNQVDIICANESVLSAMSNFDLVLLPFILDVFQEDKIKEVLISIKSTMKDGGKLIITDFDLQHIKKAYWKRGLLHLMFYFFKLTANLQTKKLKDYWKYAQEIGFKETEKAHFFHKMIKTASFIKK